MAQLSYAIEHQPAFPGDLADSDARRILPIRNNAATDLPFGRAVVSDYAAAAAAHPAANPLDNNSQAVKLPGASTDKMLGIVVRQAARAPGLDGFDVNGIRPNNMGDMVTHGAAYVEAEHALVVTDAVYFRFGAGATTDGADLPGAFRKDADIVTAWAKKTAYVKGDRRALSGKVYQCITAGTSEDSDTPALDGSTSSDATDGTAHWKYVGICDASTRASAILLANVKVRKGEVDLETTQPANVLDAFGDALPAHLAVLELNLP